MVIWEAFKKTAEILNNRREAELLLGAVLKTDITGIIFGKNEALTKAQEKQLLEYIERRKKREPVQYIIESSEFMSLDFSVDPSVLIPRSDTETLAEYLIEKINDKRVTFLDIGTGSGCIGISILKNCPNAEGKLVDISEDALRLAEKNARKNNVFERAEFLKIDILSDYPNTTFDYIVSNPPYIRPEVIEGLDEQVKKFEPYEALYGGDDGLKFYRRITGISEYILKENGLLAYEIGYDQAGAVKEIMRNCGFASIEIIKDLCGNDRVVAGKRKCY